MQERHRKSLVVSEDQERRLKDGCSMGNDQESVTFRRSRRAVKARNRTGEFALQRECDAKRGVAEPVHTWLSGILQGTTISGNKQSPLNTAGSGEGKEELLRNIRHSPLRAGKPGKQVH